MTPASSTIIQVACVVLLAPFATGMVRWAKARLQGRRGASPLLPYVTIATLLRKEMVVSPVTSWVFHLTPFVVLGTALALAALLPLMSAFGAFAGHDDFIFVSALLALGAVFLVLGGLDPGSAFGGMGASREMTIAALIEPAMITTFAAFAVASGTGSVSGMLAVGGAGIVAQPALIASIAALVLVMLAENARYPVDNPATHLELTMVHEAMVLEYSGPYLAMLELASSVKLAVFALLLGNMIVPNFLLVSGIGAVGVLLAIAVAIAKVSVAMVLLALLESSIPKMRFYRMQEYCAVAFLLAFAGLVLTVTQVLV
ncbi:MAG: NADH-quinone oxidoreductase subunit H [bacterium]|nr:NADH-quinone oxidoreductase subunit H [bacterium]